jgi:hypothetical protein
VRPDGWPDGIVPATPALIEEVARELRPEHVREIRLRSGLEAASALRLAARLAAVCRVGRRDGRTLFAVGAGTPSPLTGAAVGWLLGTPAMDRHGLWIAEKSRECLPLLHRDSGAARIENRLPADYRRARKWLAWLGFSEGEGPAAGGVAHVRVWHDRETA